MGGLITAVLCLVAGVLLGRNFFGRKHAEKLKADFAQERSALKNSIDALKRDNAQLKEERTATPLFKLTQLEEKIIDKTKDLLLKFPETEDSDRIRNGEEPKRALSLAVLATDNLDELTKGRTPEFRDVFTAKAESFIVKVMRLGDDMVFRLEKKYYIVMPTVGKKYAKVLPHRIRDKVRDDPMVIETDDRKHVMRDWRLSFGVATLVFPESSTDNVEEKVRSMIKKADEWFMTARGAGGMIVCGDDT